MPHKRKNAKAARSAPEGFSLAFLQQCGMGNKARSEEISFGGLKKILKFLSDLIGATPGLLVKIILGYDIGKSAVHGEQLRHILETGEAAL